MLGGRRRGDEQATRRAAVRGTLRRARGLPGLGQLTLQLGDASLQLVLLNIHLVRFARVAVGDPFSVDRRMLVGEHPLELGGGFPEGLIGSDLSALLHRPKEVGVLGAIVTGERAGRCLVKTAAAGTK